MDDAIWRAHRTIDGRGIHNTQIGPTATSRSPLVALEVVRFHLCGGISVAHDDRPHLLHQLAANSVVDPAMDVDAFGGVAMR